MNVDKQFIQADNSSSPSQIPIIEPHDLIGRTFLMDPTSDGIFSRAKIVELIADDEYKL